MRSAIYLIYIHLKHLQKAGCVAGAAVATPPTQPARSKNHAGELIRSPELISDSCIQSNLPTKTRQDQQSGQKLPSDLY